VLNLCFNEKLPHNMNQTTARLGLLAQAGTETLEQLSPTALQSQQLYIGVPCERTLHETRVALTPQAVALLIHNGHSVRIESKAGVAASFTDADYIQAGATIVYTTPEVYEAHIVVRISPVPVGELEYLKPNQIIFSVLNLPTLTPQYLEILLKKKVTTIAYEYLKDTGGNLPIVQTMSEIAGKMSVLIAAELLSHKTNGSGQLLGGVLGLPASKIVILGAGTVGEFATKAALGLGAEVRVFDNSIYKLRRLQKSLFQPIYTSIIQPEILQYELQAADVAIGAIHATNGRTPLIITEKMVSQMRIGSVIIDVSIDQGGCFETSETTTHQHPTFEKYGVIHYCVPNITAMVAKTASLALGNILAPLLLQASTEGGIETYIWKQQGLRNAVYCYNGNLTNRHLSQRFGLDFMNLDLLAGGIV
jgi:alanine dehydrogenase